MKRILSLAALVAALVFCTNCTKLEPNKVTGDGCPGKVSATINVQVNGIPAPNLVVELVVKDLTSSKISYLYETTNASGSIQKDFPCVGFNGISITANASASQGTDTYSGSASASVKMNQVLILNVKATKN